MLFVELPDYLEITVRSLRTFSLHAGAYCYSGSAMGRGGLASRLRRHISESSNKHWHIDYLVPHVHHVGALIFQGKTHLECTWASWANRAGGECISGFGASDCLCDGHLFRFANNSGGVKISRMAHDNLGGLLVSRSELRNLGA